MCILFLFLFFMDIRNLNILCTWIHSEFANAHFIQSLYDGIHSSKLVDEKDEQQHASESGSWASSEGFTVAGAKRSIHWADFDDGGLEGIWSALQLVSHSGLIWNLILIACLTHLWVSMRWLIDRLIDWCFEVGVSRTWFYRNWNSPRIFLLFWVSLISVSNVAGSEAAGV